MGLHGSYYAYRKDAQGNIIAILDILGNRVVEYKYDAWGNHTVTGSNTALGNLNPFRYRGYYYDTETGLYYLQTRYYDPEVGRFLNMDSIDYADPESLDGLNLYAYCRNNPVMYSDPTGKIAVITAILIGIGIGAAVGLGAGIGLGIANGASTFREWAGYIVGGIASGIIAGGIISASIFTGGAAMSLGYDMLSAGLAAFAGGGAAGGAVALIGAGAMVAGGVIVVGGTTIGLQIGSNIMYAQTHKSNGYYGERWPGDPHKPDHIHLRGNGVDIRIGRDGNPLPGEDPLSAQARKALRKLWSEFEKLFARW